jgi:DNA-directed RNA polymerase specialized sigma24 family protein
MQINTELPAAQSDPALEPFLEAEDESEARQALARLISEEVNPLVKQIVSYKLRACAGRENHRSHNDVEDLCSETLVNLLARLSEIRRSRRAQDGIRNFRGYVAVTAYRACYEYLRRKYPQRHSLKNKLRYLLTHQPGFALWETEEGEWMAGLAVWSSRASTGSQVVSTQSLGEDSRAFEHKSATQTAASSGNLKELVTFVFERAGRAIELDELVGIVAEAWKIKDHPANNETDNERATLENIADERQHTDREVDRRIYLERLWVEISRMSQSHCAALLLNLKDAHGACAIDLFLITGVASFKQLADALGQTEEWLATIWNHLPVDDLTIAEHLGLNRQQVINLRKSARQRLAKRMEAVGY